MIQNLRGRNISYYLILFILIFVLNCFSIIPAFGDHITGKLLSYNLITQNDTHFTIDLFVRDFFDCQSSSGANTLVSPVVIYEYDSVTEQYDFVQTNFLDRILLDTLSNIEYDCLALPNEICTVTSLFLETITLPIIDKTYFFANSACCWTENILNIVEPSSNGLLLTKSISQLEQQISNSPLQFDIENSFSICNNEITSFNIPVNDADGDSLAIRLCNLYYNQDLVAPPYSEIIFVDNFSFQNPMGDNGTVSVDQINQSLNFHADVQGNYVVSICIDEYRGGVLLGETQLELQITVLNCSNVVTASIINDFIEADGTEIILG